jgi:AcrR family transcriptional regulator
MTNLAGAQRSVLTAPSTINARHDQVLDEATRELNTGGVSRTSMGDIARRIGISRAAMYSYVADREDLVFQCCRRSLLQMIARLDAAAQRHAGDNAAVLATFIDSVLDPQTTPLAARSEIATVNPAQRQIIREIYVALASRLADILRQGAAARQLRSCDAEVIAQTIIGLLNWAPLAHHHLQASMAENYQRLSAAIRQVVLDGCAADRTQQPQFDNIDLASWQFTPSHAFDREAINAARREALLATASRLFNRQGYHATSLQEIMSSVGTTKRTLYRHLADKQALAAACYQRAFRLFFFVSERMAAYRGTRLQALGAAAHALAMTYLREDLSPLVPPVCYAALANDELVKMREDSVTLGRSYAQAMRNGVTEGSMTAIDAKVMVILMPGMFSGLLANELPCDNATRERMAREIANLFCVGLRAG